jgi:nanoRNase/pAp phosphatase (c-di-AMP/oligoRNAs hydrolase)
MRTRLILGAGGPGDGIAAALADRPGAVTIVTDDEHRVDTLRADGIEVVAADPTERSVLADLAVVPHAVVVADAEHETNLAAARAAAATFPDAMLFAVAGRGAPAATTAALESIADRVLAPDLTVAEELLDRVGAAGGKARQLQWVLRSMEGHLAIVTHANPDPDAIASAVALARLAARAGCETSLHYHGAITHQENRAFLNVLEFDLETLDHGETPAVADGIALVDHSRPGANDGLPPETPIDVVIDHHPPREPVEARFVDLRSDVGATSTLLVEYLERLGVAPGEALATGLLFAIGVDTQNFRRGVSPADFEAAATLLPHADVATVRTIESPTISADTLETVGRAIENRRTEGAVLLSGVGEIGGRDALAQAADRLLDLEDVNATLVFGVLEGTIHVSARARGADIDLGETLRDAFGQIGSAGGHADMAGAQIALGVLEAETAEASLDTVVEDLVTERFLAAVRTGDHELLGEVYAPVPGLEDPYLGEDATERG